MKTKLLYATFLLCVFGACFCAGIIISSSSKKEVAEKPVLKEPFLNGVIRLVENGSTYCSGVVITPKLLLTAAHCVVHENGILLHPVFKIRAADNIDRNEIGTLAAVFQNKDIAVIKGDFSNYRFFLPAYPPQAGDNFKEPNRALFSCGYPFGLELQCIPMRFVNSLDGYNLWKLEGTAMSGMSGGPVFGDSNEGTTLVALTISYYIKENASQVSPVYRLIKEVK